MQGGTESELRGGARYRKVNNFVNTFCHKKYYHGFCKIVKKIGGLAFQENLKELSVNSGATVDLKRIHYWKSQHWVEWLHTQYIYIIRIQTIILDQLKLI